MSARPSSRRALHSVVLPESLRQWAYPRVLPSRSFVDLSRDYRRTFYVAGSQRSGTTWLSDLLVESYRCRLVFEPLRQDHVPAAVPCPFNRYVDPGREDAELEHYVRMALSGRVRSPWSDRWNTVRVARRRVVKEIGQNLLLPWITRHFPDMPVVLILRHPISSAASAAELGWDARLTETLDQPDLLEGPLAAMAELVRDHAGTADPVLRHVLRWCVETSVPGRLLEPDRVLVVFFEDLSRDPRGEMDRVADYLRRFGRHRWPERPVESPALRRPSFTDWRRVADRPAAARFDASKKRLGPLVAEALALVSGFGLDSVYGAGPDPLVGPDDVLRALGSRGGVPGSGLRST